MYSDKPTGLCFECIKIKICGLQEKKSALLMPLNVSCQNGLDIVCKLGLVSFKQQQQQQRPSLLLDQIAL